MGNSGLHFVNQVFLLLGFSEMLTVNVHCEVSVVFYYKILFVVESLKRLLCHELCFKENCYLPLVSDHHWNSVFHWGKSFECSLIIEITFTLSPPFLPHWQGKLPHTAIKINIYLDHNIFISICIFLFLFVSQIKTRLIQCLTHQIPKYLLNSYQMNEKYWEKI